MRLAIQERPEPKDDADDDMIFLTRQGRRFVRTVDSVDDREDDKKRGTGIDAVAQEFRKLHDKLDLKRDRLNFYALRHTFQTIGERCSDIPAVRSIMGHVDSSMSAVYREEFIEDRLKNVTGAVHDWLFPRHLDEEGGAK